MQVKTTFQRFKFDFYPTPPSCISAIYQHLSAKDPDILSCGNVLDAGAGTGMWGIVLKKLYPKKKYVLWGLDIQHLPKPNKYDYWLSGFDFLSELGNNPILAERKFQLVVSNPPYKYAEEFVRKSLSLTNYGGYVIMLVRLAFLESIKRGNGLHNEYPPRYVSVLSRRPSFHLDKKTGSDAYMAIVWQKGVYGETKLDWITWDYEDYWNELREEGRQHLVDLGVFDEHLESKE